MDKPVLVEESVERGNELVDLLNRSNFPLRAALWNYSSDREDWRLLIATPLYDIEGPLAAYRKLDSVVREGRPDLLLFLQQVQLVSPRETIVRDLGKTFPPDREILDRHFSGTTSNTYVEHAYVYQLHGKNE